MDSVAQSPMRRSYQRRSADERVAELDKKIAELKAKQAAREKKGDPVLREIQKLQKSLKRFIQMAHANKRPDVANSAMAFKAMLDRIVASEMGVLVEGGDEGDGEA
jgi:DNA repair exonuclease SbcCD ATPase subunit